MYSCDLKYMYNILCYTCKMIVVVLKFMKITEYEHSKIKPLQTFTRLWYQLFSCAYRANTVYWENFAPVLFLPFDLREKLKLG